MRPAPYATSGLLGALVFLSWSVSPSLLPRSWLLQGAVSGIAVAAGYGIGTLIGHLAERLTPWRTPARIAAAARWLVVRTAPIAIAVLFALSARWQREIHVLMGEPEPPPFSYLGTTTLTIALAVTLVQLGRGVRWLVRRVADRLDRWLPRTLADTIAAIVTTIVLVTLLDGVLGQRLLRWADELSQAIDAAMAEDLDPPRSPTRAGGPGSLLDWEELGSRGRDFVVGGPTAEQLRQVRGTPVEEPVRVYVGLNAGDDASRASLAVADLDRAGGFDRSVLAVVVPTGTGWINPTAVDALEYLHRGDTAIVAVQYSYLPSWLSYLVDAERAQDAARALFDAVYDHWSALPDGTRPRLVVYGESLGSYGVEGAFDGPQDLRARTGGVLLVGPPNFNPLWRGFVARRDPGTPQRLPIVDGGTSVRFAARAADLQHPDGPWHRPRIVYLQQPTDPVVWWTPRLLFRAPDWLREPRSPDMHPSVRWYPVVTFAQLTVDLLYGYAIDTEGYGHRYGTLVVDAWAAITPREDWTPQARAAVIDALGRPPTP